MSVPSVKSFWTFCATVSALGLALGLGLSVDLHAKKKALGPEELTNFLLGPGHSQWLVGAIYWIASEPEIERYLSLGSDEEAAAFIEEFWSARQNADSVWPAKQPQGVYETRAREADALYLEGTRLGRRSARGTIHILFGPAEEVKFEVSQRPGNPPVEVWQYPKDAGKGLHGEKPKRFYYFIREGEYTVETIAPRPERLRRPVGSGG